LSDSEYSGLDPTKINHIYLPGLWVKSLYSQCHLF